MSLIKSTKTEIRNSVILLLTGEPGSGKTVQALSFPDPILVLDFDQKCFAIAQKHYPDKHVDFCTPTELYNNEDPQEISNSPFSCLSEAFSPSNPVKYKTVVIDSLTSLTGFFFENAIKILYGSMKSLVLSDLKTKNFDISLYSKSQRYILDLLRQVISYCNKNNINLILIAHDLITEYNNEILNKKYTKYSIISEGQKLSTLIIALFDTHLRAFAQEIPVDQGINFRFAIRAIGAGDEFARNTYNLPASFYVDKMNLYQTLEKCLFRNSNRNTKEN